MFIIVKDPPVSPTQFDTILPDVVSNIYYDAMSAQTDAMNLANGNPGHVYAVIQLVTVGQAVAPVIATPPALWQAPTTVDSPIAIQAPNISVP